MKQRPFVCVLIFLALFVASAVGASEVGNWRGINIGPDITDAGLDRIHAIGFNVVRLSMNRQPLMRRQPPYDFDEAAFARMKAIVDACHARGLKVILDPHTTPGTAKATTTLGSDPIWRDRSYQLLLVRLWDRISRDYAANTTVVGYDLLNEPSAPNQFRSSDAMNWNDLAAVLVSQVRRNDHRTTIIVESSSERAMLGGRMDRIDSVQRLRLPADDNIALSIHMYIPKEFTFQGLFDQPGGVRYPGSIGLTRWDRSALETKLESVQAYASAHNIAVFVGEFSVSRFADAASANQYLSDLVGVFRQFGWGWAYHAWGGSPVWALDAEADVGGTGRNTAPAPTPATSAPSRMALFGKLLKDAPGR